MGERGAQSYFPPRIEARVMDSFLRTASNYVGQGQVG